jgi:polyisoprenoid-binding protein YceI
MTVAQRHVVPLAAGVFACTLAVPGTDAAEARYRVDSAHTYAEFAVSHLGIASYRGKFTRVSGAIALDPEAGTGRIDVTIDAEAVVTGDAAVEHVLRGADFFNTEQFPTIRFVATKLLFVDGRLQKADGELTLLGVSKATSLTIERFGCTKNFYTLFRNTCGADATATLRRSQFGMTRHVPLVGDEVRLNIGIEAIEEPNERQ